MKTKIFWGNQHIKTINLNKKSHRFERWTKKWLKRTASACVIAWIVVGSVAYMQTYHPTVAYAEKEVIKVQVLKFEDIPLLVKICNAESGEHQFKKNGDVVRGIVNPSDIGFCQINERINNDKARRLGFDIYTEKGNKDMAIYMFLRQGSTPWNSSKEMWNK